MLQPFPFLPAWKVHMKEQLVRLVLRMYRNGLTYPDAVREFQKTFIVAVLRDQNGNQVKAARKLGMHRNTLRLLKSSSRRILRQKRKASERTAITTVIHKACHNVASCTVTLEAFRKEESFERDRHKEPVADCLCCTLASEEAEVS
jgi:hypothetical protein